MENKINHLKEKPSEQFLYIKEMIKKAKLENNIKQLHKSYSLASTYSRGDEQLKYGDSLLITAFKQKDSDIIGDCFLAKGTIYMNEEKYSEALKNYIEGYTYIKKKNNFYLINNAEFLIAQTKIYLGQYNDAHKILKRVLNFYRKNHQKTNNTDYGLYYIYTLISYIDTNSKLNLFDENKELLKEGLDFINKHNYKEYRSYFISLAGTDAYFQKKYDLAISKLDEALKLYNDNWKHLTETYYLGLSYWHKGEKKISIEYLKKISEEYRITGKIDPQFRPAFEILIDYYRDQNDIQKQLQIINQLLALDKLFETNYKYIYVTLQKEYDANILKENKLLLEDALKNEKRTKILLLILCIITLTAFLWLTKYYYKRQKHYKKLFEQIQNADSLINYDYEKIVSQEEYKDLGFSINTLPEINPLIIENILNFLSKFESENEFLQKDLTIQYLAQKCGTNVSYLSKIINQYKKNNFLSYINDLRLNYVIELWQKKPRTRHLRIQEIAEKVGFSTAQSFSKNFKEKYQISPSYFLKRLEKETNI
ncbi:response regulator transcription factor [Epilithonimonas zeae]|uniref:response regulator transcription factor n=1 Tax=Epilithonimonas zeae TaxID=1416779 RepID=UPI00200C38EF|nr:response regulator transcription factor [Epilithonimonas zeae]UQB68878.1 helix-turn-helix domain-containing protein [Epilithonimonas zeae]